jgi:hypothetical protein
MKILCVYVDCLYCYCWYCRHLAHRSCAAFVFDETPHELCSHPFASYTANSTRMLRATTCLATTPLQRAHYDMSIYIYIVKNRCSCYKKRYARCTPTVIIIRHECRLFVYCWCIYVYKIDALWNIIKRIGVLCLFICQCYVVAILFIRLEMLRVSYKLCCMCLSVSHLFNMYRVRHNSNAQHTAAKSRHSTRSSKQSVGSSQRAYKANVHTTHSVSNYVNTKFCVALAMHHVLL